MSLHCCLDCRVDQCLSERYDTSIVLSAQLSAQRSLRSLSEALALAQSASGLANGRSGGQAGSDVENFRNGSPEPRDSEALDRKSSNHARTWNQAIQWSWERTFILIRSLSRMNSPTVLPLPLPLPCPGSGVYPLSML